MQPGSHSKLAYKIRARVPNLKTYGSRGSKDYFTKSELRTIARHLGIDQLDLKAEIDDDHVHKRHLQWAIIREVYGDDEYLLGTDDFGDRFNKREKRTLISHLDELQDND